MKRIAGELNQAETTFLLKITRADWRLRSFTAAGVEVFGAGHNALETPRTFHQQIGEDDSPSLRSRDTLPGLACRT